MNPLKIGHLAISFTSLFLALTVVPVTEAAGKALYSEFMNKGSIYKGLILMVLNLKKIIRCNNPDPLHCDALLAHLNSSVF